METVHVNLGPRSYDIALASGESNLGDFARRVSPRSQTALVVADENTEAHADTVLASLKAAGFRASMVIVQAGEETKSLFWAGELYDELAEIKADRQTLIVPVGGGVIGDLAGFAAATYNRGLPMLMVPTTLLSMVDSSVGGKVGINHEKGKNLIGAFHQPVGVWLDLATITTLPDREYRSGLAEVVKYGMILDAEFFGKLEAEVAPVLARDSAVLGPIILRCCRIKADVVEQDEREETGLRAKLNFGHTFAHAYESVAGYGTWLHGEAVAAGMVAACELGVKLGRHGPELTDRLIMLLKSYQLPTKPLKEWETDELLEVMRRDKKNRDGKLRFILASKLGQVEVVEGVEESLVRSVLAGGA